MTTPRSPLSVRLDPALAEALDRHCEQTGEPRSRVVQQSLAQYLITQTGPTLGSLAEAVLPFSAGVTRKVHKSRQKRYRDYVSEKRRR